MSQRRPADPRHLTSPRPAGRRGPIAIRRALLALAAIATLGIACASAGATTWAWSAPSPIDPGSALTAISCPSTSLCVATDAAGDVVRSTQPTTHGARWLEAPVDRSGGGLRAIACPSRALCVAIDRDGDVVASTDPSAKTARWRRTAIDPGHALTGISCPSRSLCVAVDDAQAALTATDPTGGATAWTRRIIDTAPFCDHYGYCVPNGLTGISCPSVSECVASDDAGDALTSTDPAAASPSWSLEPVTSDNGAALAATLGVACPSTSLCVIAGEDGAVITGLHPADPAPQWSYDQLYSGVPAPFYANLSWISCPLTTLCLSANGWLTNQPRRGGIGWQRATPPIDGGVRLGGAACASASRCVVVDKVGDVIVGTPAVKPKRRGLRPRIVGVARVGRTLTARPGDWSGTAPVRFGYQWQRCHRRCVAITGAIGSRYRLAAHDRSFRIGLQVIPWDPAGYGHPADSAETGPVMP